MRPIPKKLLIHAVAHVREKETDRWGDSDIVTSRQLTHVRMEPSGRVIRDKNNAEVQLEATMFYDCRNSCPAGIDFREDDIIVFNGQKYSVKTVEPLYDGERLHHYELGLIKHA